ncbi:MAG: hypothetical protein WBW93_15115 [Steroidobacteraceae bacterium]
MAARPDHWLFAPWARAGGAMSTIAIARVDPWDAREDRKTYLLWVGLMWAGLIGGFGLDMPHFGGSTDVGRAAAGDAPRGPVLHPLSNLLDIGGFGLFTAAGYFLRRDPASHKRMMMLAMVSLADPGFARITGTLLVPFPDTFWSYLIATFYGNLLLLGLMAGWDLWRRGTLNRPFAIGATLLVASEVGAIALYFTPGWKPIAIAITRAWGYAG